MGFLAFVGISLPSFWLGIMLIRVFSTGFGWFPPGGIDDGPDSGIVSALKHLVLPVAVLATLSIGVWTRYVRSSMLEVIKQDYVRTARAKGLDDDTVIWKHALRNALIPFITILGISIPALFSGALITETVFSWPGMGRLLFEAVDAHDYNLAVVSFMFLALLTLVFNLIADVAYAFADPRIRLS
jgi:peptide/nickel transport system permease protein